MFTVDRVWAAWTENPADDLAKEVAKFEEDLRMALRLASDRLRANDLQGQQRLSLHQLGTGLRAVLASKAGGFDADGYPALDDAAARGRRSRRHSTPTMSFATHLAGGQPPRFLLPGAVIEQPWLPGVRFYVLGPPRSLDHAARGSASMARRSCTA